MVRKFGMSDLGPVYFDDGDGYFESQKTKERIDEEVQSILKQAYKKTFELLKANRNNLEKLARALLERETLSEGEAREILGL